MVFSSNTNAKKGSRTNDTASGWRDLPPRSETRAEHVSTEIDAAGESFASPVPRRSGEKPWNNFES